MGNRAHGLFAERLLRSGSGFGVLNHGMDLQLQNVCPFHRVFGENFRAARFNQVPAQR